MGESVLGARVVGTGVGGAVQPTVQYRYSGVVKQMLGFVGDAVGAQETAYKERSIHNKRAQVPRAQHPPNENPDHPSVKVGNES